MYKLHKSPSNTMRKLNFSVVVVVVVLVVVQKTEEKLC